MKHIELKTFLEFKYLGNLRVSPNEKSYALVSAKAHHEDNAYHHELFIKDQNQTKKVLSMKKNSSIIFLDNQLLLIDLQKTKKEEKDLKEDFTQSFYTFDLSDKKLKAAFKLPFKAEVEAVLKDKVLLLSANMTKDAHILYQGTKEQRADYIKEKKKQDLYEDIDELPYYFNGSDFIQGIKKQLFLYDISTQAIKGIFDVEFSMENYLLSDDQKTIYYTGKSTERVKSFTSKIFSYDILKDQHQTLYDNVDYNIVKLIEINQKLVVAAKDMQSFGLNQNPDFFILKDNTLRLLSRFGQSIGNSIGSDCRLLKSEASFVIKDTFYFTATIDDHSEIKALKSDGTLHTVFQMKGAIDAFVKYGSEALIIGMKDQKLQELYKYDFNQHNIKQQTRLNSKILSGKHVLRPRVVVVKKPHHDVKGFVLLPPNFDEKVKYPAILNIHGGPKTVYGQIYYHEMQYWANEGYIVLFANPRGSDGKGDQFADIRGKYGTIDYEDLMDFTDWVLKKYPAIDQEQLFVTGGSYGGFMTNWIIGHTNRFKAAVTQRSISNWVSFYGTSDIGYYFATDQTAGHPIAHMEKLYEQSPIKYVMNVKTPLLFIHSDKDHRCPMEQAQQFYAILKTQGLDTKLVWIKNENHELSRSGKPQARIKRLTEITKWFKKYTL